MKKLFSLITVLTVIITATYFTGCGKDDPVTPNTNSQGLIVNASVRPTSRITATGTMFATDNGGTPIGNLSGSNISASLQWVTDSAPDSTAVTIQLTPNSTAGNDIAAGITMDYSGSMLPTMIDCMENGVHSFINAMPQGTWAEIIKFDHNVITAQPYTQNKTSLNAAVDSNYALGGSTALYQSIFVATTNSIAFNQPNVVKGVVAFTDGFENASTVSRDQMINLALTNAIPVYTVQLYQDPTQGDDLKNIADTTGGFYFYAHPYSCTNLNTIYQQINAQLNNSYSMSLTWLDNNLPTTGTQVTLVMRITHGSYSAVVTKTFILM